MAKVKIILTLKHYPCMKTELISDKKTGVIFIDFFNQAKTHVYTGSSIR